MKHLIRIALAAGLVAGTCLPAAAQQQTPPGVDSAAFYWARRLLETLHAQGELERELDALPAGNPFEDSAIPDVVFDSTFARMRRLAPEFVDSVATFYATRLSAADLKELTQFYESPLGQRYAAADAEISALAEARVKRWTMRVFFSVMIELIDKGVLDPSQ